MVLTTNNETTTGETPGTAVSSAAFGIDELAALATLLGASRFPGVPEAPFTALREGVRKGDLAEAREHLGADGSAFADAMADFKAWCTVRVLRRGSGTVEGGETTWIDAGAALWRVEARGEAVHVQPISAVGIVDEVLGNLSGGA